MKCMYMYNKLHLSLDEWKLWWQIFTNLLALHVDTSLLSLILDMIFWQFVWPSRRVSLERSLSMTTENVTTFLMTSLSHLCIRTILSPTKQTVSRWKVRQSLGTMVSRDRTGLVNVCLHIKCWICQDSMNSRIPQVIRCISARASRTRDIRAPDVMTFCLLMETLAVERLFGDGGVYRCSDSENERVLVNYWRWKGLWRYGNAGNRFTL